MQITITYDTREGGLKALKASDLLGVINDMNVYLRDEIKYGNHREEKVEIFEEVQTKLCEYMREWEVQELVFG